MHRNLLALLSLALPVGCATMPGQRATTRPTAPAVEYAELRWELSPTTRAVTLEVPGDQFHGVWFEDAMNHARLARPQPSNTQKSTSSDLLTMLGTRGWKLVTHAMGQDAGDLHVEVWTLRRTRGDVSGR